MNENLLKILKRYHRRHLIEEKFLDGETSLSRIKEYVKDKEASNQDELQKLYDEILHKEEIIHPESAQLATELQAHLQTLFPDFSIAIILIGSSVRGGKRIRSLFLKTLKPGKPDSAEVGHDPDFDFVLGISYKDKDLDLPIDTSDIEEIDKATEKFLQKKGSQICETYRPSNYAMKPLQPKIDVALQGDFLAEKKAHHKKVYAKFFAPSFPPDFNEKNRRIFLEYLTNLAQTDPDMWNEIVSDLIDEWKEIHVLKEKYFSLEAIKKPNFKKTLELFNQTRLKIFKNLLKSTTDEMGGIYIDYM